MHLYKTNKSILIQQDGEYYQYLASDWDTLINRDNLYEHLTSLLPDLEKEKSIEDSIMAPPVQSQEIWAAGVTYLQSKKARMEESEIAGGKDFYEKVYDAERPELFFKSTAERVSGHKMPVRIRKDSKWNVPEPELTLFINSSGNIVGYTIGNDMSSRDIEGENPLYLPQAKTYDGSAAIGPCLYVSPNPIDSNTEISMKITRKNSVVFEGTITLQQMKRTLDELTEYLFRELTFPNGVYLMTGTCLVPDNTFTLKAHDQIDISISGIGTLSNYVSEK